MDAHVILEYLPRMDFVQWIAPTNTRLEIHRISRRLLQLKRYSA